MARYQYLLYGQPPGWLGFAEDSQGVERGRFGIIRPRQSASFPEGTFPAGRRQKSIWWPPPPEFQLYIKKNHSSKMEWHLWLAAKLIFKQDPGEFWFFQYPFAGGRRVRGGQVIDVAITGTNPPIAVRLQSDRYHVGVNHLKRWEDEQQRQQLLDAGWWCVNIYEQYLRKTLYNGRAALFWMRQAMSGVEAPSPAAYRTSEAKR